MFQGDRSRGGAGLLGRGEEGPHTEVEVVEGAPLAHIEGDGQANLGPGDHAICGGDAAARLRAPPDEAAVVVTGRAGGGTVAADRLGEVAFDASLLA